nr:immunoglobulin light chain junction region [Macaca mulatta]
CQQGYRNPFNF